MATVPKLIVLSKNVRGQTYELTKPVYTIGRTKDRDICLPDGTVSTLHAELIKQDDGSYTAEDKGSTNGTRINGIKLTKQKLVSTDILQVGGIELLYDCEDQKVATVMSTQTAINLNDTAGNIGVSETMNNISPFNPVAKNSRRGGNKMVKRVITGVLGVLILIAIVILVRLISSLAF